MTDLTDIKAAARKAAFAARKEAHSKGPAHAAPACIKLIEEAINSDAQIVAGYMPIRTEIDVLPAMLAIFSAGKRVCVPVIKGAGQPLEFHEWTPESEMVDGPFGAKIPADAEILEPELVIAPLVGFDRGCNRLGYGGGFYDRSLELLRAKRPTKAIGFAYAAQELEELPLEPTDQQLDMIITEEGVIAC